jgi:hypothetical protein
MSRGAGAGGERTGFISWATLLLDILGQGRTKGSIRRLVDNSVTRRKNVMIPPAAMIRTLISFLYPSSLVMPRHSTPFTD